MEQRSRKRVRAATDAFVPGAAGASAEALGRGARQDSQRVLGGVVGGRYLIEQRLGAGTAGVVYRARHRDTGGCVALKLLRREHVNNARVLSRFLVEARHLHRLHHPNTVRLFDYGQTEDGVPFLVMEHLVGTSLRQILQREGALPPYRVLDLADQVLKSLGEAHSHNVVHRDVKPANIMVSAEFGEPDFVKVVDFGIACLRDSADEGSGPVGSPTCMAPEQWTTDEVDGRADLYALGCVMYHMLTGRPPFVFRGASRRVTVRYMLAHLNQTPPSPLELVPGVCPQPLADLVMRLLAKDADQRPASAHHALVAVDAIRSRYRFDEDGWTDGDSADSFLTLQPAEPTTSLVTRLRRRVATVTGLDGQAPPPAPAPAPPRDRTGLTYGLVIALLACLLGGWAVAVSWALFADSGGWPDAALARPPAVSTALDTPGPATTPVRTPGLTPAR